MVEESARARRKRERAQERMERRERVRDLVVELLGNGGELTLPDVVRYVGGRLGWEVGYPTAVMRLRRALKGWGAIVWLNPESLVGNYRGRPPWRMRLNRSYLKARVLNKEG